MEPQAGQKWAYKDNPEYFIILNGAHSDGWYVTTEDESIRGWIRTQEIQRFYTHYPE